MKLAIVGSTLLGGNKIAEGIIICVLEKYKPTLVISGGAKGIDKMAVEAARVRGIEVREHLPKTNRWHDGYRPRNVKIAEDCDRLVRIAAKGAVTYGSGWTRDYAEALGKPTEEYVVE